MSKITWNTEAFQAECVNVTMDRLEVAAKQIADDARTFLTGKVKGDWQEHGPYKRRVIKSGGKRILSSYTADVWTARYHGDMAKTIRVVRKHDANSRNVWIMAGNYKVWWALQLEYGFGGWRGKGKPFLRRAMANAPTKIKAAIEGGATGGAEI